MDKFQWWTELTHGGIFISNPVLNESFEERQLETWHWKYKRLRDNYNSFLSKESVYRRGSHPVHTWITHLFEDFLGHDSNHWLKGQNIPQRFSILSKTGMPIKPRRVLTDDNGEAILLLQRDESQRLGMHKGRRSYAQFVDLLRKTNVSLGVLINGHQIRLVYAGMDHDAWVQFQVDAWFDEGETRHQLDGFLTLLHPDNLKVEEGSFPLLDAVNTSRTRQADLADVLGDQIRQAVELLTSAIGRVQQSDMKFLDTVQITPGTESILSEADTLNAVYQAATRLVMRKVILFYAEAKELLPKDNPFYFDNYSIEGLFSQLMGAVQHTGEEELKTKYSAWQRFLALYNVVHEGSDHEIMPLKAYGGTLFRRGDHKSSNVVLRALSLFEQPNIGITDYEVYQVLRLIKIGKTKVRQGRGSTYVSGPVDFGDMRTEYIGMMYEGLLDYELKKVEHNDPKVIMSIGDQPILPLKLLEPMDDTAIKNLFKTMKVETDSTTSVEDSPLFNQGEEASGEHLDDSTAYGRSLRWAVKAVEIAQLVSRPRGAAAMQVYEEKKLEKARSLVVSVLEPGEMYLSRWGGTRKGSGTFYTKPSLAVPTTWRTLEPLVYDIEGDEKKVKTPKDILNLKVCDPAVGSGTFLVASARYLTEVLYESVLTHILVHRDDDGNVSITPSELEALTLDVQFEAPPIKPTDDGWEEQMKARLKRLIVERCLFGVDYNGMAVELARLALWLETMDKDLPFEFLDHRIKQGNSLVGTWFKQHADYPIMAWEREAGDGSRGELTRKIKQLKTNKVKPDLAQWLNRFSAQYSIIEEQESEEDVIQTHLKAWTLLNKTSLFDTEKREEIFYKQIGEDKEYNRLKKQFDRWISVWFWPVKSDAIPLLKPSNFDDDDEKIDDIVEDLKSSYHFFHWELEFPEVFMEKGGFDAILGNPPWNTLQPESLEFFSNYDPIYRTYGKQEALKKQREMFETNPAIYEEWINYSAFFKGMSNFVKASINPFEVSLGRGSENQYLLEKWQSIRNRRKGYIQGSIPYQHQGSGKIDLYQLFLELSYQLLNEGGRLGMISPSGIYTDKGNTNLRTHFFENANWEWLFAFENKEKIFDIHRSFKFGPLILTKGGRTESVKRAFMRHDVKEWESANPPHLEIPVEKIKRFSPNTLSFMEFKSEMDLQICEKIYGDRPLLGDQVEGGWNVKFAQEFNMTSDSHLFTSRRKLEEMGLLTPDEDTRDPRVRVRLWKDGYVPLYEGKNFWIYNGYYSEPDKFVNRNLDDTKVNNSLYLKRRIMFRDVSASTNERTAVVFTGQGVFHGNTCPDFTLNDSSVNKIELLASSFCSFTIDFIIRKKITNHLNYHYMADIPFITNFNGIEDNIVHFVTQLTGNRVPLSNVKERLINTIYLDILIAYLYGIDVDEFTFIISAFSLVDRNLPIEQRQTTLTLEAFKHLKQVGLERFLEEGWELPDYVTEFDRPGIKIWEPNGGWKKAWADAKAMLTEDEWQEFTGESAVPTGSPTDQQEEEPKQVGLF